MDMSSYKCNICVTRCRHYKSPTKAWRHSVCKVNLRLHQRWHIFEYQWFINRTWWRHQMETFSALLALCAGNSPASGEFPTQRSVTRGFDVFLHMCLNKRLRKQSWGWWFETLSRPLRRHCNDMTCLSVHDETCISWMIFINTWAGRHAEGHWYRLLVALSGTEIDDR